MTEEERIKEYARLCDEAHSHLESPLLGSVTFPICKSCEYSNYDDSWNPKCDIYGDMPKDFMNAHKFDCPAYKKIPNCPKSFLPLHIQRQMEQENK